ncbi:hypothetical protein A7D27_18405 [Pseudomonas sp. 1D4]|uniref:hypothetical protein n=1 Tax=Pseudomonas sp. 1D4 TaxID=1843691 RepID=UPI00084B3834|nr:hypothetical protein [Pseudomonas sp. 1D4]OEC39477.1 hypothetical protein A7D27_18405 [Pseudomonas sp. 1D4]
MNRYLIPLGLVLLAGPALAAPATGTPPVAPAKPFPHIGLRSDDGRSTLDIGGALRLHYRDEHWKTTENNGRFLFDTFRLDVQATHEGFFSDLGYWFQDDGKRAIDRGFVGYRINDTSSVQLGAPFKPFGLEPYPQFGWSYHIPFFLGYGSSAGAGAKYLYKDADWLIQVGYFPRMLPSHIRFSPEVGRFADLDENAIPSIHQRQDNEKRDQVNLRVARTLAGEAWKAELGASLATARLYNATTGDDGSYRAGGVHAVFNTGQWTVTTQGIRYLFDPQNPAGVRDDVILMGGNGLTPAYLIATRASVVSFNVGYDVPTPNLGMLKTLRFYNDYSRMLKDRRDWDDSQMFTAGVQFIAMPIMGWLDFTWGRNANPYGGAESGTGFTSATSSRSNEWVFRTNLNLGYYF